MARLGVSSSSASSTSRGRAATGSVAGGGTATIVVTFAPAMPDLNFTATATVQDAAADLRVLAVVSITASSVSVLISNSDTLNASSGTVHVLAVRD